MIMASPVSPTTSAARFAATDCRTEATPYPKQATMAPNQLSSSMLVGLGYSASGRVLLVSTGIPGPIVVDKVILRR